MAAFFLRDRGALTGRGRWLASALIVGAVTLVAAITTIEAASARHDRVLACRVLPNLVVPFFSARTEACPLRAYDRILAVRHDGSFLYVGDASQLLAKLPEESDSVALLVRRRGEERVVELPVLGPARGREAGRLLVGFLLGVLLLGPGLLIMRHARTPAALPLLLFYACLALLVVVTLAPTESRFGASVGSLALALVAPVLFHLTFTFPRERPLLVEAPSVLVAPYGWAVVAGAIALLTFERAPLVWALSERVMLALAAVAAASVLAGCLIATNQARSSLERARAKICLSGMVLVAVLPALVAWIPEGPPPGGSATLLALGAGLFPLPIGYAVCRYQLFDVALEVQRATARLVVPAFIAMVVTAAAVALDRWVGIRIVRDEPAVVFGGLYGLLLIGEALRAPLWSAADAWASRRLDWLRVAADRFAERMRELRSADDVGRECTAALEEALGARPILVYAGRPGAWRLLGGRPDDRAAPPPKGSDVEREAARWPELLHLAREEDEAGTAILNGIELAVPLRCGEEVFGAVLIGPSATERPYASIETGFVRSVCCATAMALHNAHLTEDILAAERFAEVGRLGAELAHAVAKPLGVLERLAVRIAREAAGSEGLTRRAGRLAQIAGELRGIVRGVLEPKEISAAARGSMTASELVDRALQLVAHVGPPPKVVVRLEPGLPDLPDGGRLVRALANVVENALLAQGQDPYVEIVGRRADAEVWIEVGDRGEGMSEEVLEHALEPFFTTRRGRGGSGLGLALTREAVEGRGGRVEIESKPGRGTRVRIRLPVARTGEGSR